ncbi:hypothetical protein SRHO_G00074030 [Serrasalmus rhombeus]
MRMALLAVGVKDQDRGGCSHMLCSGFWVIKQDDSMLKLDCISMCNHILCHLPALSSKWSWTKATKTSTPVAYSRTEPSTRTPVRNDPPDPDTQTNTYSDFFIYGAVGGLLLLMLIGGAIYWRHRAKRREQMDTHEGKTEQRTDQETQDCSEVLYCTIPSEPAGKADKIQAAVWCDIRGSEYKDIRLTVKVLPNPLLLNVHAATPAQSLPFVPFALVTVIILHVIVAVVYHTKRNKGPDQIHHNAYEDGTVSLH